MIKSITLCLDGIRKWFRTHGLAHAQHVEPQIVFLDQDHGRVFNWLLENCTDDCVVYLDTLCAVDDEGEYRWKLTSLRSCALLLYRPEDVIMFQLAWV